MTNTQHRPITFRMATVLLAAIVEKGPANLDPRSTAALLRRGLLEEIAQRDRWYRVTQLGRETLAKHLDARGLGDDKTTVQPNVVVECFYWQDFYGVHAQVRYWDDPMHLVRFDWTASLPAHDCLRFTVRNLTDRHLMLACCPQPYNPDTKE